MESVLLKVVDIHRFIEVMDTYRQPVLLNGKVENSSDALTQITDQVSRNVLPNKITIWIVNGASAPLSERDFNKIPMTTKLFRER